ncbi:hypothetical protein ACMDCR_10200 [Labrys okinawensis]|uniref:hypothetical protein n=1 Tax=Labrys okinawensis TaxID=346911 RepID=UPI0039BD617F
MPQLKITPATDSAINATLFSVFVVAGAIYIIFAKLYDYPAAVVTAVPVVFMLAYALIVMVLRRLRLRLDQVGDNSYYMGFLFTLTSLGVSLYLFQVEGAAEEIVRNFGVAIASTIAGVALRVLFGQMRQDPYEVEQASRLELAEATRRVRRELDTTVMELAHFRRSSQQMILEGLTEVREGATEATRKAIDNFEDLTKRAAGPIEASADATATVLKAFTQSAFETIEAANTNFATQASKLTDGTRDLAVTLAVMSDQLKELKAPSKVIEEKLEPSVTQLTDAVGELNKSLSVFIEQNAHMTQAQVLEVEQRRNARFDSLADAILNMTRQLEAANAAASERRTPFKYFERLFAKEAPDA